MLGVVAAPIVVGELIRHVSPAGNPSGGTGGWLMFVVAQAIGTAGAVLAVAIQAVTLTDVYRTAASAAAPANHGEPVAQIVAGEPAATPADASVGSPPAPSRVISGRIGRFAAVLALAVTAIVPSVRAARAPHVTEVDVALNNSFDELYATGWPAGHGPVFVMYDQIIRCDDDTCRHPHRISSPQLGVTDAAAVAADGTVLLARSDAEQGNAPDGTPLPTRWGRIEIDVCRPDTLNCDTGGFTWAAAIDGPPVLAIAGGSAGALAVGSLQEHATSADAAPAPRFAITQCPDYTCTRPLTTSFDDAMTQVPVPIVADEGVAAPATRQTLAVSMDAHDLPTLTYSAAGWWVTASCADATCTNPHANTVSVSTDGNGMFASSLQTPDGGVIDVLNDEGLTTCTTSTCTPVAGTAATSGALASDRSGIVVALRTRLPSGVVLHIGTGNAGPDSLVFWRCRDPSCDRSERIVLAQLDGFAQGESVVARPDGSVMVVQGDGDRNIAHLYLIPPD
jgi:hypothetical protein